MVRHRERSGTDPLAIEVRALPCGRLRAIIDETAQRHHRTLTIKPESDLHQTKIAVGAGPGRGNNLPLLAQHLDARLTQRGPLTLKRELRQLVLSHPAGCGASIDTSDLSIWRSVAAMMPPAAIARIASATSASMSLPYSFATNGPDLDVGRHLSASRKRPSVNMPQSFASGGLATPAVIRPRRLSSGGARR